MTPPPRGLSAVVAYKLGKAALELVAVVVLLVFPVIMGTDAGAIAGRIARHWLHGFGAVLAYVTRFMAESAHVHLIVLALAGDSVSSAVEGILLWRRSRWARWVVLFATGVPLPWELILFVRHPSLERLALLVANGAILGLVWRPGSGAGERTSRGTRHVWRRVAVLLLAVVLGWLFAAYRLIPTVERRREIAAATAPAAGRTTDAAGKPADPVNVGLVGDAAQVRLAMQRAGWSVARPITVESTLGILGAVVFGRSDARAPVSDLFLDGRRQDLAFERQVGGNPRRRHHVRFWRQDRQVDGRLVWLGAATFDEGVEIARGTGQITHRVSPHIDDERDTLVADLERGGCAGAVFDTPGVGPRSGARTADGRLIDTDGRVAVVELGCDAGR